MTCEDCRFYDNYEKECDNEEAHLKRCRYDTEPCELYAERKNCKHRIEHCDSSCSIICHSKPSGRGCKFRYVCGYDETLCDEHCEMHESKFKVNQKRNELSELIKTREFIDKLISNKKLEIQELEKQEK